MFYTQLNNSTPIETLRCGLSCFSIQFHIPKRNIKSSSTYLTPSSSAASLSMSSFLGRTNESKKTLSQRIKKCIEYLWITRISIQFNSIPCLIILLFLFFISIFLYIEQSNGHYYYHQISTLSFLSQNNSYPTLYDLHQKVNDNYPNVHIIAGPPLSRQDLGHISWLFLHTQGVTYSEEPTEQRKKDLLQFWDSFSRLYPCGECAKHMRLKLKKNPPNVENNKEYSKWLCGFHNDVTLSINPNANIMDCNDINGIFTKWSPNEFCGCDNEFIEGVDDINNMNENILKNNDKLHRNVNNNDNRKDNINKKNSLQRLIRNDKEK
eukprot:390935_1